jgi:hypothetical protein
MQCINVRKKIVLKKEFATNATIDPPSAIKSLIRHICLFFPKPLKCSQPYKTKRKHKMPKSSE